MAVRKLISSALVLITPISLFADFQYQEKTQVTGGSVLGMMKMAGAFSGQARQAMQPIESSVFVKGNKMAHVGPHLTEIIDLDKETITHIDHDKRQYSVVTFEQMRQQMEEAARKAKEESAKQSAQQPAKSGAAQDNNTEMSFDVKVRPTSATRDIAGLQAKEAIMSMMLNGKDKSTGETGSLAITNDMWMASDIPGYSEVRDFQVRMAKKLAWTMSGTISPQLLAMQPNAGKGMAQMIEEMSKLKGTPVASIMRMGVTANGQPLPAASEAPLPPQPDGPTMADVSQKVEENARNTAANNAENAAASKMGKWGGLTSGLGSSLGGFGRKKKQPKQETPPPAAQPASGNAGTNSAATAPGSAVLIESSTEMSGFSTAAIDNSKFSVPSGYQQVEAAAKTK